MSEPEVPADEHARGRRRRVLIVTYYWPPSGGSGVQRWLKLAKYLPESGWEPVIVAPADADYELTDETLGGDVDDGLEVLRYPIREPYALYRRLTGDTGRKAPTARDASGARPGALRRIAVWARANLFVPDPKVWWVGPTVKRLGAYLAAHPVDAIVTTGPPHSIHLIGRALKRAHPGLAWLVDIRDPWSQFDVHLAFGPGRRAREKNRRLERACLAEADRVVATSYSMPDHLEPFERAKFRTVTNGYDAADFERDTAASPYAPTASASGAGPYVVLHAGLLTASRNPSGLWRALADYCAADAGFAGRLELHLIGSVEEVVLDEVRSYGALASRLRHEPWVSHAEIVTRYASADLLLLCPNRSDNARGQINGKLFEYLAAGKPILHIGPFDSDNTRILDQTHAGITVPPGDADGALDALRRLYDGRFAASPHALRPGASAPYTRSATARQLAKVLDELVG